MAESWAQSPRGRRERAAVFAFCAVTALVPLIVQELYPFSAATMFAFRPGFVCLYEVRDPQGGLLDEADFGLEVSEPHDPPATTFGRAGYGRRSPCPVNLYYAIAPEQVLFDQVRQGLADDPGLAFVNLTRKVVGPRDSRHVGVIRQETWKVQRSSAAPP